MTDKERDQTIDSFRQQHFNVLISTNVLARGIDVPEVDIVISYDIPFISQFGFKNPDFPNYLHRVGRTGRFGTDGLSVTLYSDETEKDLLE
jgi:ATP-dependent RNA helicase DDX19/DBP5